MQPITSPFQMTENVNFLCLKILTFKNVIFPPHNAFHLELIIYKVPLF